jgi:hypothetical protein
LVGLARSFRAVGAQQNADHRKCSCFSANSRKRSIRLSLFDAKSFIGSKQIWLQLQVMGVDMVGSEVVAGLVEEQPKRIIVALFHELQELGAGSVGGTFGVFG